MGGHGARSPGARATRALVIGLLGRMTDGAVIVHDGDRRYLCGRPVAGERIPEVEVLSGELWRAFATEGIAGLGRGWFSGWWTCGDLDDLTSFLRVLLRNAELLERTRAAAFRLSAPLRHLQSDDLLPRPEALERLLDTAQLVPILDDTMTGSTALFASARSSLAEAQAAKHDRVCRLLRLAPADHVLEVGTGLGSFALHAARTYGCRVTATTDTATEAEVADARVKEAGLEDLVTVLHEDYHQLTGSFTKLVAIEALYRRGWREHDAFFEHAGSLLVPEGLLALQCVVVADQRLGRARRQGDFVTRYVLPGASLPSTTSLLEAATRRQDLRLVTLDDIGQHRAETLRRWRHRLGDQAVALDELGVDDTTRRLVEFRLCYEEATCAERRSSAIQCLFARERWRPAALSLPGR